MDRIRKEIQYDSWKRGFYNGHGVGVAILDTGIYLHEDYGERVVCFRDFVGKGGERPGIVDPADSGTSFAYDNNGHGTHVAGIIAGDGKASRGKYQGIATGSHIIACKVLDEKGNGNTKDVLKALRFCIENKEKYQIRMINISIGTIPKAEKGEQTSLIQGVEQAWDAGIVVVVAAGNNGPKPMTVTTPGISRKVITVGSMDEEIYTSNKSYSGRGPTPYCIVKPEVVAPGGNVTSCLNQRGRYCTKSGTSMATAVVSGCIALLLQKYPGMSNRDVKLRLFERAVDMGQPKNRQGWGMVSLNRLL